MAFQKIVFEKNTVDNKSEFKINNKFVTEEVYYSTLNDDSLYDSTIPPLPKVVNSPENSYNNDICQCPSCQELLDLINELRGLDNKEALNILKGYIEGVRLESHYQTASEIYSELGNSMIKLSGKLELELEDMMNEEYSEEEIQ